MNIIMKFGDIMPQQQKNVSIERGHETNLNEKWGSRLHQLYEGIHSWAEAKEKACKLRQQP